MARIVDAQAAYRDLFQNQVEHPRGIEGFRLPDALGQYRADAAYWYGTLTSPGPQGWKGVLLHRMWLLIWHGGLWMKNREGLWQQWAVTHMPIASCLSHGARVLVQLPPDAGETVWHWLWGGHATQSRSHATHGVTFETCATMPDGRPKQVRETKEGEAGHHFFVNLAGGGEGNTNPISGTKITDDGRHGHLYIYYARPTATQPGALMFGAEDAAPVDCARAWHQQGLGAIGVGLLLPLSLLEFAWVTKHQPVTPWMKAYFPKGQVGAYHALGASGPYSLTGGEKFKAMAPANLDVPVGLDSMFINPSPRKWEYILDPTNDFQLEWLGWTPPLVEQYGAAQELPTTKEFQAATSGGRLHFRDQVLKQMDDTLNVFHQGRPGNHAQRFIELGELYASHSKDSQFLKAKVAEFVERARRCL